AAKLNVPIAHVEAGLRSFDRTMPEEVNRLVTDRLADLLLTPSADADANLMAEGVPQEKIHRVGNVMVDTLRRFLPKASLDRVRNRVPVRHGEYVLLTLHRPSNVDDADLLAAMLDVITTIAARMPVVFPVHPRTRERMTAAGFNGRRGGLFVTEPMGYIDFLSLT